MRFQSETSLRFQVPPAWCGRVVTRELDFYKILTLDDQFCSLFSIPCRGKKTRLVHKRKIRKTTLTSGVNFNDFF